MTVITSVYLLGPIWEHGLEAVSMQLIRSIVEAVVLLSKHIIVMLCIDIIRIHLENRVMLSVRYLPTGCPWAIFYTKVKIADWSGYYTPGHQQEYKHKVHLRFVLKQHFTICKLHNF